jgi:putative flippase GtrA
MNQYWPTLKRFATYVAVGATGTACQYALLLALVQSGLARPVLASTVGAIVGAIVNYTLNYRYTFKSQAGIVGTAVRFAAISVTCVGVNAVLMHVLTLDLHCQYLLAQCITSAMILLLTYYGNLLWTFRSHGASAR